MKRQRQQSEDQGPKVPGYIVTYSDMVTLLLTFFVMLLTLADVQDPELFDKGRDAFLESIRYAGLGMFFGKKNAPELGTIKTKHGIDDPEETSQLRTLDARKEQLRRILENVKQKTKTVPSQITSNSNNFTPANIRFQPGRADLDEPAKQYLNEFCNILVQSSDRQPIKLYILGLAPEEENESQQLMISAMRAEITAKYIRQFLSSTFNSQAGTGVLGEPPEFSVYSWGAGAGGQWSSIFENGHILIATMR